MSQQLVSPVTPATASLRKLSLRVSRMGMVSSAVLAVCVLLRLVWISDVPYILDEPQLFANAMEANMQGRWAERGLQGSQGVHYGALPTWIYQVALRVFDNPIDVAFTKSVLITLITLSCLWVWAQHMRGAERFLLAACLLSPCLWFYARDLWDNSWGIPFSMITWTSYLYFNERPSLRRLVLPALGFASLILIHLMSLPLIAAIGSHFVVRHRQWIRRRWAGVAAIALMVVAIDFAYVAQLFQLEKQTSAGGWSLRGLLFFLKSPAYFSSLEMNYFLGSRWMEIPQFAPAVRFVIRFCAWLTLLSFAFFSAGLVQAVRRGVWVVFKKPAPPTPVVEPWVQVSDVLSVLTVGFFTLLSFAKGLAEHPHYFNAVWPAVFYLIWRGCAYAWAYRSEAIPIWFGRAVVGAWGAALLFILLTVTVRVHWGQGTRSLHYGPTLGNLWEVSADLLKIPGAEIIPVAFHARFFPLGLQSLVSWRLLHAPEPTESSAGGRWLITYRDPKQTWHGGISLMPLNAAKDELEPVPGNSSKSVEK